VLSLNAHLHLWDAATFTQVGCSLVVIGSVQTMESPEIVLFRIPGPGKSWKKA